MSVGACFFSAHEMGVEPGTAPHSLITLSSHIIIINRFFFVFCIWVGEMMARTKASSIKRGPFSEEARSSKVPQENIAQRAYSLYEARGRQKRDTISMTGCRPSENSLKRRAVSASINAALENRDTQHGSPMNRGSITRKTRPRWSATNCECLV